VGRSVVFVRDQFPVPRQKRLRRHDAGDLRQNPVGQSFGLGRQTPALIVVEPQPSAAKLFL